MAVSSKNTQHSPAVTFLLGAISATAVLVFFFTATAGPAWPTAATELTPRGSQEVARSASAPAPKASSTTNATGGDDAFARMLRRAAMEDRTVIMTSVNEAWAAEGSLLDSFLESFRVGLNISHLVKHIVVVAMDEGALRRCRAVHPHCHLLLPDVDGLDLSGAKSYMTKDYLDLVWSKLRLQHRVLLLGYNLLFTARRRHCHYLFFQSFLSFFRDVDRRALLISVRNNRADISLRTEALTRCVGAGRGRGVVPGPAGAHHGGGRHHDVERLLLRRPGRPGQLPKHGLHLLQGHGPERARHGLLARRQGALPGEPRPVRLQRDQAGAGGGAHRRSDQVRRQQARQRLLPARARPQPDRHRAHDLLHRPGEQAARPPARRGGLEALRVAPGVGAPGRQDRLEVPRRQVHTLIASFVH
ncbi:uncharacterized protein [Triticum aestivum]|uniref:uncharacterized protein isoform X1 n=1 Tax=Triticum aestivum TaxID=4565 RepID=UPI001D0241FC|nr:uncharacterized protein LOC123066213 isoform X1 [Triticum aestivum]